MGVKISSLTNKSPLSGTEELEINDGGTTKKTTAQDIADLGGGGGGGGVESVTGDGVNNADSSNPVISFPTLSEAIDQGGQINVNRVVDVTGTATLTINANTSSIQFQGDGGIQLTVGSDADGDMYRRASGSNILERRTPSQVLSDIGGEAVSNKATDFTTINNTLYPTIQATQNEIIARLNGFAWKTGITCATTANITLSGEQTIDGIATSSSRVLVKNQSTASQNGIYVSAAGAWSRASDADTGTELEGATVRVQQGTTNADTTWTQTTDGITLGSSSIVWTQMGATVPNANSSTAGIAKLYSSTSLGTNTDGAPDQNAVKSYTDTGLALKVAKAGDTMGGNLAMGNNKVTGLGAASGNGEAVRYEQLPVASSESVAGLIEIATQAETNTGTDDLRAITPLKAATRYAPLASPTLTGVPAAPTASAGTNTTQIATTAYVQTAVGASSLGSLLYMYNNFS